MVCLIGKDGKLMSGWFLTRKAELVDELVDEQICVVNNNRVLWPTDLLGLLDQIQSTEPSPEPCVLTFTDEGQET